MKSRRFLKMIAVATTLVASSLLSSTAYGATIASWDFTQASGQTNDTVNSYNLTTGGTIVYNTTTGADFGEGYNKLTFDHADLNPKNAGAGNTWVLDITGQKFNVNPVGDTYHAIWGQRSSTEDHTGLWIYKYKNADSVANKYQVWYGTGTDWGKLTPNVIPQLGSTYDLRISYDVTTDTLSFGVSTDGGDFETVTSPSGCNLTFATGDNSFNFGYIEKFPDLFSFNGTIKSASISVNAPDVDVEIEGYDEIVVDGGSVKNPIFASSSTAVTYLQTNEGVLKVNGDDAVGVTWAAPVGGYTSSVPGLYQFVGTVGSTYEDGFVDLVSPISTVYATLRVCGDAVSINFGPNLIPTDAESIAGAFPVGFWENAKENDADGIVANGSTDISDLKSSTNINTGISLSNFLKWGGSDSVKNLVDTFPDQSVTTFETATTTHNDEMMSCFVSADEGMTFTFSNINAYAATYDVYVYVNNSKNNTGDLLPRSTVTANGIEYFIANSQYLNGPLNQSLYTDDISSSADRTTNYVKFSNVQLDTLVVEIDELYHWSVINGIQIVAVEPGLSYLTPAIGLDVVQDGTVVTWTVESQAGVEKYIVTDAAGKEYEIDAKDGVTEYSVTVENEGEVAVTVVDTNGYAQTFVPADGSIERTVYDLVKGWNLVAIAGDNAEADKLGTLWGWNGYSYEIVEAPKAGQAVWVYSASDAQVIVESDKVQAELELNAGWNMVGPTENMDVPAEAHTVYGWTDTYQTIANDGTLLMGVGYWIFCDK